MGKRLRIITAFVVLPVLAGCSVTFASPKATVSEFQVLSTYLISIKVRVTNLAETTTPATCHVTVRSVSGQVVGTSTFQTVPITSHGDQEGYSYIAIKKGSAYNVRQSGVTLSCG
ncbi:MAG TPA: hypothetical protein VGS21_03540 [Acidimicrobiales bacterium]|nr:hypothetical protein [Acidimicrobiales bacterium]